MKGLKKLYKKGMLSGKNTVYQIHEAFGLGEVKEVHLYWFAETAMRSKRLREVAIKHMWNAVEYMELVKCVRKAQAGRECALESMMTSDTIVPLLQELDINIKWDDRRKTIHFVGAGQIKLVHSFGKTQNHKYESEAGKMVWDTLKRGMIVMGNRGLGKTHRNQTR